MIVLGIDPGSRVTGYGLVEAKSSKLRLVDYGVVRTDESKPAWERLQQIFRELGMVISRAAVQACAVEDIYYGKNFRSAIRIGEARAAALLAATSQGVPVFEYQASVVKKSVSGNGNARKDQVQHMVRVILGLACAPEPEDAADALALALCHLHRRPPS